MNQPAKNIAPIDQGVTGLISVIEKVSVNPDFPIDKMEKLLDTQERVLNKQAEAAFARDMALAQAEIKSVIANRKGHNSVYADRAGIATMLDPVKEKYGFSLLFVPQPPKVDGNIAVSLTVMHREGHKVVFPAVEYPPDTSGSKNAIQAKGSSTEYACRYLTNMAFDISIARDVDGGIPVDRITEEQAADLRAKVDEYGIDHKQVLKWLKLERYEDLPAKNYKATLEAVVSRGESAK